MSIFTRLSVALDVLLNGNTITAPAEVKSLSMPTAERAALTHVATPAVQYSGSVTPDDLMDLNSTYIRNAVASLGAWSALAKGFNAFLREPKLAEPFVDEFHAWNSVVTEEQQMNEEATLEVVAKLTQVKPAKGNDATDQIIARVRKIDVAAVRAEREAKAAKDTQKREAALLAYSQLIWSMVDHSESQYALSGAKAVSKAIDTMGWIAQWNGNPDAIAGELLLCEADVATLERIAKKEAEMEGQSQGTFA